MNKYSSLFILVIGCFSLNIHAKKHGSIYFCTTEIFENNAKAKAQFSTFTDSETYKPNETRESANYYGLKYCFIGSKSGSYYLQNELSKTYSNISKYPSSFFDDKYVEIYKSDVLNVLNSLDNMAAQFTFIDRLNIAYSELCTKYKKKNIFDAEIKLIKSPKFYTFEKLVPFDL